MAEIHITLPSAGIRVYPLGTSVAHALELLSPHWPSDRLGDVDWHRFGHGENRTFDVAFLTSSPGDALISCSLD